MLPSYPLAGHSITVRVALIHACQRLNASSGMPRSQIFRQLSKVCPSVCGVGMQSAIRKLSSAFVVMGHIHVLPFPLQSAQMNKPHCEQERPFLVRRSHTSHLVSGDLGLGGQGGCGAKGCGSITARVSVYLILSTKCKIGSL